jgi:hypothetical protein
MRARRRAPQSLDGQIGALRAERCSEISRDKASGKANQGPAAAGDSSALLLAPRCCRASLFGKPEDQATRRTSPEFAAGGRAIPGARRNAPATALQDISTAQPFDITRKTSNSVRSLLERVLMVQPAVLIDLIAHSVGTTLQEDLARTTDRLLRLSQDFAGSARSATLTAEERS